MNQSERQLLETLRKLQLPCSGPTPNISHQRLDPGAPAGNSLEFDALLAAGACCVIGEIHGFHQANRVQAKFARWSQNIAFFRGVPNPLKYARLKVPARYRGHFRQTNRVRSFFITNSRRIERGLLPATDEIAVFTRDDWDCLRNYAECIGPWARYPLLAKLGLTRAEIPAVDESDRDRPLELQINETCFYAGNRSVSPELPRGRVYTFTADPAFLLSTAQVFRDDRIPGVTISGQRTPPKDYQRILIPDKLSAMAAIVRRDARFMFPTPITVVLDRDCRLEPANDPRRLSDPK